MIKYKNYFFLFDFFVLFFFSVNLIRQLPSSKNNQIQNYNLGYLVTMRLLSLRVFKIFSIWYHQI